MMHQFSVGLKDGVVDVNDPIQAALPRTESSP
jgi:hypothetical protein